MNFPSPNENEENRIARWSYGQYTKSFVHDPCSHKRHQSQNVALTKNDPSDVLVAYG